MRKPKAISRSAKGAKIQVRLRPEQKAVLIRAAGLRRTSLSNFVLKHSIDAARQVLAEQTDIVLSPTEWRGESRTIYLRWTPTLKNRKKSLTCTWPTWLPGMAPASRPLTRRFPTQPRT